MSELLDFRKDVLRRQPFSVLMGTELTKFEPGAAELRLEVKAALMQQHGFVHGGMVSYLADNCLTSAGGSVLGDAVTSEYKINYVRPALGKTLIARGSVLSAGKRQAACQCKVFVVDEDREKLARKALSIKRNSLQGIASTTRPGSGALFRTGRPGTRTV